MRLMDGIACAPRKAAQLPLSIAVFQAGARYRSSRKPIMMPGLLRDISETGLAMIVPSIRSEGVYLTGADRMLEIAFEVSGKMVELKARPVRYERIERQDIVDSSYLIGARMTDMAEPDRARFVDYVRSLN
jgi:hypothetical protein